MKNEDIFKSLLEQYFNQFKEFHLIILFIFAMVQGGLTWYMLYRMEKLKAFLKKSEIKFSRYHEMQIEALRLNYQKIVEFNGANSSLLNSDYNTNSHNEYKIRIVQWLTKYNECISQLSFDKILLPQNLINLINNTISDFSQIFEILANEKENLENIEMESGGNWNIMYEYNDNELSVINNKINKLKSQDLINNSNQNIRSLRKSIEEHFAEMNK